MLRVRRCLTFTLDTDHRSVDELRWDENAGLRRDAVRSQVIDVLTGVNECNGDFSPIGEWLEVNCIQRAAERRAQIGKALALSFAPCVLRSRAGSLGDLLGTELPTGVEEPCSAPFLCRVR
jgi:hypothetical protein